MTAQLIIYGLFGLSTGLGAHALMPGRSGNSWIAALLGVSAAVLGVYLTRLVHLDSGEGTTLFMVVSVTFLVFAAYRTAFRRFIHASDGEHVCPS